MIASCSEDTASEVDPSPTESATVTAAAAAECPLPVGSVELTPGCWTIEAVGGPQAQLNLPAGFFGSDWGVWIDQAGPEDFGNIALRATGDVYRDPCHRVPSSSTVGPTVEDFTTALAAQKMTRTTRPEPVEVDGYAGMYVEVSVPASVDLSECPNRELVLWQGRADEVAAVSREFMKRYWVLDVNGERVVLAVATHPHPSKEAVERFSGIVESAQFTED